MASASSAGLFSKRKNNVGKPCACGCEKTLTIGEMASCYSCQFISHTHFDAITAHCRASNQCFSTCKESNASDSTVAAKSLVSKINSKLKTTKTSSVKMKPFKSGSSIVAEQVKENEGGIENAERGIDEVADADLVVPVVPAVKFGDIAAAHLEENEGGIDNIERGFNGINEVVGAELAPPVVPAVQSGQYIAAAHSEENEGGIEDPERGFNCIDEVADAELVVPVVPAVKFGDIAAAHLA
jgi:translation elongation factor EF-1beta